MKKKILTFIPLFIILLANSCTGYKPIFSASNLKFQIVEHSIKGNKRLANQIYSVSKLSTSMQLKAISGIANFPIL